MVYNIKRERLFNLVKKDFFKKDVNIIYLNIYKQIIN